MALSTWWKRFWFEEAPPHIFALLRITIGAAGVLTMLGLIDVPLLMSLDGIAPTPGGGLGIRAAIVRHGLSNVGGWAMWIANFGAFAALTLGWRTPIASLAAFGCSLLMIWWNPLPLSAGQHLLHVLTLYPLFFDGGRVWSLDARARLARGLPLDLSGQPVWPLRLLQYQMCLMYFAAALWKLLDASWRDGTALHYILNYNAFQRFPVEVPPASEPIVALLTYVTIVWEGLFPLAMFNRVTKRAALLIGVALHLGMWLMLEIGPFSPTVLAAYVAFLDPQWVKRIGQRWAPRSETETAA